MIVVGLTINIVAPANAKPGSNLPVIVVCILRWYTLIANHTHPLGSGYLEVRRTQCLRHVALTNKIYFSKGGFEFGSPAGYGQLDSVRDFVS